MYYSYFVTLQLKTFIILIKAIFPALFSIINLGVFFKCFYYYFADTGYITKCMHNFIFHLYIWVLLKISNYWFPYRVFIITLNMHIFEALYAAPYVIFVMVVIRHKVL